jgi:hypothetical protein
LCPPFIELHAVKVKKSLEFDYPRPKRLCHNVENAMFVILNPSLCHSERSEESRCIAQDRLREESRCIAQDKLREESCFFAQDKLREESHTINELENEDSSADASE